MIQYARPVDPVDFRMVPTREGSVLKVAIRPCGPHREPLERYRDMLLAAPHDADDPYLCEVGGDA